MSTKSIISVFSALAISVSVPNFFADEHASTAATAIEDRDWYLASYDTARSHVDVRGVAHEFTTLRFDSASGLLEMRQFGAQAGGPDVVTFEYRLAGSNLVRVLDGDAWRDVAYIIGPSSDVGFVASLVLRPFGPVADHPWPDETADHLDPSGGLIRRYTWPAENVPAFQQMELRTP